MGDRGFFVHDRAICESEKIGEGTRIWGFSHILAGASIGRNCNIGEQVFIENEVVVGDGCTIKNGVALWDKVTLESGVFVGPYAVFTNDLRPRAFLKRGPSELRATLIERGATIGANATIVCGVTVGAFAMVGAGCVVTEDVPPHALVVGNPVRKVARLCYCGTRLEDERCPACGKPLLEITPPL